LKAASNISSPTSPKWVPVPGGFAREDCIHTVPNGAAIDVEHGNVIQNGAIIAHYDDCPEPPIMYGSGASLPGSAVIPNNSGWVEVASDHMDLKSGQNITSVSGAWVVPSIPANYEGQTLFVWNGVSDDTQAALLQPVLQLGPSHAGTCANCWGIASWALFPNGTFNTPLFTGVNPGDTIVGKTSATQNGGTLNWKITATDTTIGLESEQDVWTTGYKFSWAWGAVLEAWNVNVSNCSDFPGGATFIDTYSSVQVINNGGQPTGWARSICANSSSCNPQCPSNCFDYFGPSCGFGVGSSNPSVITLDF